MNQPVSSCLTRYEERLKTRLALRSVNQPGNFPNKLSDKRGPESDRNLPASRGCYNPDLMDTSEDVILNPESDLMDTSEDVNLHFLAHLAANPSTFTNNSQRNDHPGSAQSGPFTSTRHPTAAKAYGLGHTLMDDFDDDAFAETRGDNLYYPFASRHEWEVASFLLGSRLSMAAIDRLLKLELVSSRFIFI